MEPSMGGEHGDQVIIQIMPDAALAVCT